MSDDPFIRAAEDLVRSAAEAAEADGVERMTAENRVVGEACDAVAELSQRGDINSTQANALADQLSDTLGRYTKTDLKDEFKSHFQEQGDGVSFDTLIENRLDELKIVHTTDAKQGTVWRWHFSDGVQLETETSKDGGRKHLDWQAFKRDYFDSLVALGKGEQIGAPTQERRDSEQWQQWIDQLILSNAETVRHVGPRTEAVDMLRDHVERSLAYHEAKGMVERSGIWVESGDEAGADGGFDSIRVPTTEIKRICDHVGISTRALQIELEARGVTDAGVNGVSDSTYVDGGRVGYWALSSSFAEPDEVIDEISTPAEKAQEREQQQYEEERTSVGAVDEETEQPDPEPRPERRRGNSREDDDNEYEPGHVGSFGSDPDEVSDDD